MTITLSDVEARVLGLLVELQFLEPSHYPATAARLLEIARGRAEATEGGALDRHTLRGVLKALEAKQLVSERRAGWFAAPRYAHRFGCIERAFAALTRAELALLGRLMTDGPLGPAELLRRTAALHPFKGEAEVQATLNRMLRYSRVPLVTPLAAAGGEEPCYTHLFDPRAAAAEAAEAPLDDGLEPRLARLEQENAALREAQQKLQKQIDILFAASPTVSNKLML